MAIPAAYKLPTPLMLPTLLVTEAHSVAVLAIAAHRHAQCDPMGCSPLLDGRTQRVVWKQLHGAKPHACKSARPSSAELHAQIVGALNLHLGDPHGEKIASIIARITSLEKHGKER